MWAVLLICFVVFYKNVGNIPKVGLDYLNTTIVEDATESGNNSVSREQETTSFAKENSTKASSVQKEEQTQKNNTTAITGEPTMKDSAKEQDKGILTDYQSILEAFEDGFNAGRKKGCYEEVSFSSELSQECRNWAEEMVKSGKGYAYHSNIVYISRYFNDEADYGSEGVGLLGLETYFPVKKDENGELVYMDSIQVEYENYVFYETAFSAGEAMCYHIGAHKKNVVLAGFGMCYGVTDNGTYDYYTCVAIVYE